MIIFDECGKFEFEKNFIHMRRTMRFDEFILMTKGEMYLAQEDERFTVREGDIVHLSAGKEHYGWKMSDNRVEFYWLHFRPEPSAALPLLAHLENYAGLLQLFRLLMNAAHFSAEEADCAATLLIASAGRGIIEQTHPNFTLASDVCRYVEAHFAEDICVRSVARKFGYSPDYISSKVRAATGMSLKAYITHCRLLNAKLSLLHSALSVDEIAKICGFSDSKRLFKLFRLHEGMTPTQYRRSNPEPGGIGLSIKRSTSEK